MQLDEGRGWAEEFVELIIVHGGVEAFPVAALLEAGFKLFIHLDIIYTKASIYAAATYTLPLHPTTCYSLGLLNSLIYQPPKTSLSAVGVVFCGI